jgi:plasmid replication initiation protein
MYELCQKWQGTDGFRISVEDLRKTFVLENKYPRYALLNDRVLQVAKRELKALYDMDSVMFTNLRKKERPIG